MLDESLLTPINQRIEYCYIFIDYITKAYYIWHHERNVNIYLTLLNFLMKWTWQQSGGNLSTVANNNTIILLLQVNWLRITCCSCINQLYYNFFIPFKIKALKDVFNSLCRQITNRWNSKWWWDLPARANCSNSSVCQYCVKRPRCLSFCSIWDAEKQSAVVHSGTHNYRSRRLGAVRR